MAGGNREEIRTIIREKRKGNPGPCSAKFRRGDPTLFTMDVLYPFFVTDKACF
jgi:hypothetical protein